MALGGKSGVDDVVDMLLCARVGNSLLDVIEGSDWASVMQQQPVVRKWRLTEPGRITFELKQRYNGGMCFVYNVWRHRTVRSRRIRLPITCRLACQVQADQADIKYTSSSTTTTLPRIWKNKVCDHAGGPPPAQVCRQLFEILANPSHLDMDYLALW